MPSPRIAPRRGSRPGGSALLDDVDALDPRRIEHWDGHPERRALAERRAHADVAAEDGGEAPGQREAQARAAQLAVALGPELDELLERPRLVVPGQARPRVADLEAH